MSTQGQGITFAPASIGTFIVDAEFKLRYLRELLEDESFQFQRKNIEFLIHYYENGGKLPAPGQTMWLLDGKIVDKRPEKIAKGSAMWSEASEAMQMGQSTSFGLNAAGRMHEIFARFRLPAILGGNLNLTFDVSIMNDTGSDIQTIFPTDLAALGYNRHTYLGRLWCGAYSDDRTAITPWFREDAVVTPQPGNQDRLSGNAMRNHLFFATAPGNAYLFVAEKKNGIVAQLPVV